MQVSNKHDVWAFMSHYRAHDNVLPVQPVAEQPLLLLPDDFDAQAINEDPVDLADFGHIP